MGKPKCGCLAFEKKHTFIDIRSCCNINDVPFEQWKNCPKKLSVLSYTPIFNDIVNEDWFFKRMRTYTIKDANTLYERHREMLTKIGIYKQEFRSFLYDLFMNY